MSTSETLPTTYRGYFIDKETHPWRNKAQDNVRFSHGSNIDEEPGFIYWASDLDEAKDMIDDLIAEKEIVHEALKPSSPLSISGDTHKLQVLLFAVDDYRARLGRLVHEYPGIGKDVEMQRDIILEWQGIIATQIKDQKFDEETKD